MKGCVYIGTITLIMVLFMVVAIPAAFALSTSDVTFDKIPLSPGETTDMYITITNYGPETNDISIQLVHQGNESPYPLSGGSSENIGILEGSAGIERLPTGKSKEVKFSIFSASTAEEGLYNLDVIARYKGLETISDGTNGTNDTTGTNGTIVQEMLTTISIQVVKKPSNVIIEKVSDTVMAPGSAKEIDLTVTNVGKKIEKNVALVINSDDGQTVSLPHFTVVDSGSRFALGDINPGGSADVTFKLSAGQNKDGGDYIIPIYISSENGGDSTEYISVRVVPKAELTVVGVSADPPEIQPGKPTKLMVSIRNYGKNDAKSVRVDIEDNLYIDKTPTAYLGYIKAEDYSTAVFELNIKKDAPESFPIKIKIVYQDGIEMYQVTEGYTIITSGVSGLTNAKNMITGDLISLLILLVAIPVSILIISAGYRKRRMNIVSDGLEMYAPKVETIIGQNAGQNYGQTQAGISQDQDWFSQMMGDKKSKS